MKKTIQQELLAKIELHAAEAIKLNNSSSFSTRSALGEFFKNMEELKRLQEELQSLR